MEHEKRHFEKAIDEALVEIRKETALSPGLGIILGTGMGALINRVEGMVSIPYRRLPGFPYSSEEKERLILGNLLNKSVVILPKRFHYYEGYSSDQIAFPVRLMRALGVQTLIICNCAGGLNPLFKPGDLMLIVDHINLIGRNPLIGPNIDRFGQRFPDMKDAYHPQLVALAEQTALEEKIRLHKGIYVAVIGPSLETPAETRFLRSTGADAVGMSTVPEVIVGIHAGMRILGFSIISNVNLPDAFQPIDYDEIVAVASRAESTLIYLLEKIIAHI